LSVACRHHRSARARATAVHLLIAMDLRHYSYLPFNTTALICIITFSIILLMSAFIIASMVTFIKQESLLLDRPRVDVRGVPRAPSTSGHVQETYGAVSA
jgi:hypothetical protein